MRIGYMIISFRSGWLRVIKRKSDKKWLDNFGKDYYLFLHFYFLFPFYSNCIQILYVLLYIYLNIRLIRSDI